MREIVYSNKAEAGLLTKGAYRNYDYAVVSQGTHPCGYVRVPTNHPYYGKSYDDCNISCHGGLKYSDDYLYISTDIKICGWWIGWDYTHLGDYLEDKSCICNHAYGTKYTTQEVITECHNVIDQLIEIQNNIGKENIFMIGLNNKGMERLAKIQGKYKFMNHFELESDDVYEFCSNIIAASRLGLCLEDDDESFIQMVLDNISV